MGKRRIGTAKEVAKFLVLKESTVCRLAADRKLPGVKIGKCWRFDMDTLERSLFGMETEKRVQGKSDKG